MNKCLVPLVWASSPLMAFVSCDTILKRQGLIICFKWSINLLKRLQLLELECHYCVAVDLG